MLKTLFNTICEDFSDFCFITRVAMFSADDVRNPLFQAELEEREWNKKSKKDFIDAYHGILVESKVGVDEIAKRLEYMETVIDNCINGKDGDENYRSTSIQKKRIDRKLGSFSWFSVRITAMLTICLVAVFYTISFIINFMKSI